MLRLCKFSERYMMTPKWRYRKGMMPKQSSNMDPHKGVYSNQRGNGPKLMVLLSDLWDIVNNVHWIANRLSLLTDRYALTVDFRMGKVLPRSCGVHHIICTATCGFWGPPCLHYLFHSLHWLQKILYKNVNNIWGSLLSPALSKSLLALFFQITYTLYILSSTPRCRLSR